MPAAVKPRIILFDCYNTLLETRTDEHDLDVWQGLANFLSYQGLHSHGQQLHDRYFHHMRVMQKESAEEYPEIDMVRLFRDVLAELGYQGPELFVKQITQLFRALSIRHLAPFPDTIPALQALKEDFCLGIISDAQRAFIDPEMERAGLLEYFDVRIISGDFGYRKPDKRLFRVALEAVGGKVEEAIYVGDNIYRDVCGAHAAGMPGIWIRRHEYQEVDNPPCTPDETFGSMAEFVEWLKVSA